MSELTQEYLNSILEYNKDTGLLTNKVNRGPRARKGALVGTLNNVGYLQIKIYYKVYKVHRVIWALVNGYWPTECIDHIDGNRLNNSLANLREASKLENNRNRLNNSNNTSGFKGVTYNYSRKKFIAQVHNKGNTIYLGGFTNAEEASKAYQAASKALFGEFYKESPDESII